MAIRRGTYDATGFDSSKADRADVLIVGAGPAGATVAKRLSEWGLHVVCLEQGSWVSPGEYTGTNREHEASLFGRWHKDPNVRRLPADYPCQNSQSDITPVMYNGVGGGSIHFGGMWPRFLPTDFRLRSTYGIADDWPISWQDLAPFYNANDIDFACAGMAGDPAFPPFPAPPFPAHPITEGSRRVAKGMNELGWHWWPAPNAIASSSGKGLNACVRYGVCETGCPNGSKASVDLTHWPAALRNGATLITQARVREIRVTPHGLAAGALFLDTNGHEHVVRAETVVLAANGVGTARLLLLSRSKHYPDGLSNSSGLVGHNLMLNPTAMAVGIYPEAFNSWQGPAGQNIHSFEFYETDHRRGHALGASWCTMPAGGPYAASVINSYGGGPTYGRGLIEGVSHTLGHAVLLCIVSQDLPEVHNFVDLDPNLCDAQGIPAPRITYSQNRGNLALIEFHLERATEALLASGASQVLPVRNMPEQPGHLLGTAKMGINPNASVVDPFCRSHDVRNLFIVDGSTFVSAGGVSPTSTICAIARRAADHILEVARNQVTPS